jgi:hypothetical protein
VRFRETRFTVSMETIQSTSGALRQSRCRLVSASMTTPDFQGLLASLASLDDVFSAPTSAVPQRVVTTKHDGAPSNPTAASVPWVASGFSQTQLLPPAAANVINVNAFGVEALPVGASMQGGKRLRIAPAYDNPRDQVSASDFQCALRMISMSVLGLVLHRSAACQLPCHTSPSCKQISSLEAQLASKLAQLSMLESQNQQLKGRARILEVVVRARDEQVWMAVMALS